MFQTLSRLKALPVCANYKGRDCGPMCQCGAVEDAITQMESYTSDVLAIGLVCFASGMMVAGAVAWVM